MGFEFLFTADLEEFHGFEAECVALNLLLAFILCGVQVVNEDNSVGKKRKHEHDGTKNDELDDGDKPCEFLRELIHGFIGICQGLNECDSLFKIRERHPKSISNNEIGRYCNHDGQIDQVAQELIVLLKKFITKRENGKQFEWGNHEIQRWLSAWDKAKLVIEFHSRELSNNHLVVKPKLLVLIKCVGR